MMLANVAFFTFFSSVLSIPVRRSVDPNLVPPFGVQSGLNPTGMSFLFGRDVLADLTLKGRAIVTGP